MVDRKFVEAADALRFEMVNAHDGSFAPFVDRSLKDKIEAYDAARSRHASGAQPDSACDEIGWLVEITGPRYWTGTPGCGNWTADSRAAMRFARRQDAEAACRHLAPSGAIPVEHAWVSHRPAGAQPSGAPAPASAQGEVCECGHPWSEHVDGDDAERHARRYGWTCVEDGCECAAIPSKPLPAPAESAKPEKPALDLAIDAVFSALIRMGYSYEAANDMRNAIYHAHRDVCAAKAPAQDGEPPTVKECLRVAHEAIKAKHPHTAALAAELTEDERECVMAVRALCLASRARDASWRIEVRGSQPQCWVVVDPSGDCGEQSFTVGPGFDEDEREDAEHFARMTSTALERLASRAYSEPTVKSCLTEYAHALTKADVPGSIPSERHRAGIEAVLAHCLNRAPDAEYLRKYAEAVLASRAPSIDEVVDALLRVQPFRDGHETGPTGLVRRADVEQVMRALFDRRSK